MPIQSGSPNASDEVMNALGSNFNDIAQNIFNADYLGFDSRLNNSGAPNYKNVFYSTFTSDDADTNFGFDYDSTNDLYIAPNLSYYILVEATSFGSWSNSNNTKVVQVDAGKWLIYCTTGTDEVKRAQVMKSLFFGTSGSDQLVLDFTTITTMKSSDSRDVGKGGHYASITGTSGTGGDQSGAFVDTTTNTDCSSWSNLFTPNSAGADAEWEIPNGSIKNSVGQDQTSNELGTDTSADEVDNPANCDMKLDGTSSTVKCVILCSGTINWSPSGDVTATDIDFNVDNSIPDFIAASDSEVEVSTLIFKDTVVSTDNAIVVINSQIDATSSEQISISANGGSNYTDVDNTEIARPTSGTELWRKIVITRTDLSKEDKVTEQAVKYNFY